MVEVDAIKENQPLEVFELTYNVVSSSCGLTAFDSSDSDSDVRGVDHIDIIGAVSNRQSPAPFFDYGGHLLLSLGGDSAANHTDRLFENLAQHLFSLLIELCDKLPT